MQMQDFPRATKELLAILDLEHERGELTDQEYADQEAAAIEDARAMLGLDTTWRTDPTAPERQYTSAPATHKNIKVLVATPQPDGSTKMVPTLKPDAMPERFVPTRRVLVFWRD